MSHRRRLIAKTNSQYIFAVLHLSREVDFQSLSEDWKKKQIRTMTHIIDLSVVIKLQITRKLNDCLRSFSIN